MNNDKLNNEDNNINCITEYVFIAVKNRSTNIFNYCIDNISKLVIDNINNDTIINLYSEAGIKLLEYIITSAETFSNYITEYIKLLEILINSDYYHLAILKNINYANKINRNNMIIYNNLTKAIIFKYNQIIRSNNNVETFREIFSERLFLQIFKNIELNTIEYFEFINILCNVSCILMDIKIIEKAITLLSLNEDSIFITYALEYTSENVNMFISLLDLIMKLECKIPQENINIDIFNMLLNIHDKRVNEYFITKVYRYLELNEDVIVRDDDNLFKNVCENMSPSGIKWLCNNINVKKYSCKIIPNNFFNMEFNVQKQIINNRYHSEFGVKISCYVDNLEVLVIIPSEDNFIVMNNNDNYIKDTIMEMINLNYDNIDTNMNNCIICLEEWNVELNCKKKHKICINCYVKWYISGNGKQDMLCTICRNKINTNKCIYYKK